MLNNLRILVLLLALSVAGFAGYSFISKFNHSSESEEIHINEEGVDVEIKNFKARSLHFPKSRSDNVWKIFKIAKICS